MNELIEFLKYVMLPYTIFCLVFGILWGLLRRSQDDTA